MRRMSSDLYKGADVEVKTIHGRDGVTRYGLFRPMEKHSCLDVFENQGFANLVAMYIDLHGGNYAAVNRKAAEKFAEDELRRRHDSISCD